MSMVEESIPSPMNAVITMVFPPKLYDSYNSFEYRKMCYKQICVVVGVRNNYWKIIKFNLSL